MGKYIITYDLHVPGKDYSKLYWILGSFPYAKITESVWVINSSESASSIYDKLKLFMDTNDSLFVGALTGEASWDNCISPTEQIKARVRGDR